MIRVCALLCPTRYEAFELEDRRERIRRRSENSITFVVGMGLGSNIQLDLRKAVGDAVIPFQFPEGPVYASFGPDFTPPGDKERVMVKFQLTGLETSAYFERVEFFLEQLAAQGDATIFVDAYPESVTQVFVADADAPPSEQTRQQMLAGWFSGRQESEPELPEEETTRGESTVVEMEFFVDAGSEDELLFTIQQSLETEEFESMTGYPLVLLESSREESPLVEDVPVLSYVIIASTVAIALVFGLSGQTATVIMGADSGTQASDLMAPLKVANTSATNTVNKVVTPVQFLAARGLVNVGTTEPFIVR